MKKQDSLTAKSYSDFEQSKKTNRITIACLSITSALLAIMAFTSKTEIIVKPAQYEGELRVHGRQANQQYMLGHAMGIASLVGNISERNADFVTTTVLGMMSPFLRGELESGLKNEVQILKVRKASQQFVVEDMMYEPKNNIVWVWGLKTLKVHTGTEHKERWTYEFRIEPQNGSPRITHFDSYSGVPKQKNNEEYTVDSSPYLTEALDKVKEGTDPEKARYPIRSDAPPPAPAASPNEPKN